MNSDQKAVAARIKIPINLQTQKKKAQVSAESTGASTIDDYQTHQNTTNTNTDELSDKLADAMTSGASTTQKEEPQANRFTANEHAEPIRQLIKNRNATPKEDRQTKKDTSKRIKKTFHTIKNEGETTSQTSCATFGASKTHPHQNRTQDCIHNTQAGQSRQQRTRQTGNCG